MATLDTLRSQFLLDPDVVFLNHGSYGACPLPVFETYQRWQRELERQPVEFLGRRLPGLLAEARARLGAYVGADADDLVFVPNATAGINVVARSLKLAPGDEIVATELEYGACDLMWRHLCARAGATYVRTPVALPLHDADAVVEALLGAVTERTRAIFVSHVTSATALILPVEEICRRAHALGVPTIVDGAHAPAYVDLDVRAADADYYAGNCHKWLCAPKGAAYLHVRPELQDELEALVIGWGFGDGATFLTRNEQGGTRDPSAWLSVPAAIDWQAEHDWHAVRERCRALALEARAGLAEATGTEPLAPAAFYGQMASTRLPRVDAGELKRRLYDEHRIEVPTWPEHDPPLLRVSIQAYNDESDLDALLGALARLI